MKSLMLCVLLLFTGCVVDGGGTDDTKGDVSKMVSEALSNYKQLVAATLDAEADYIEAHPTTTAFQSQDRVLEATAKVKAASFEDFDKEMDKTLGGENWSVESAPAEYRALAKAIREAK